MHAYERLREIASCCSRLPRKRATTGVTNLLMNWAALRPMRINWHSRCKSGSPAKPQNRCQIPELDRLLVA